MVSLFGRGFDSLQLHSINQEAADIQRFLFYFYTSDTHYILFHLPTTFSRNQ